MCSEFYSSKSSRQPPPNSLTNHIMCASDKHLPVAFGRAATSTPLPKFVPDEVAPTKLLSLAIQKRRSLFAQKDRDYRRELLIGATISRLCKHIGEQRALRRQTAAVEPEPVKVAVDNNITFDDMDMDIDEDTSCAADTDSGYASPAAYDGRAERRRRQRRERRNRRRLARLRRERRQRQSSLASVASPDSSSEACEYEPPSPVVSRKRPATAEPTVAAPPDTDEDACAVADDDRDPFGLDAFFSSMRSGASFAKLQKLSPAPSDDDAYLAGRELTSLEAL